jgi:hypothetical protein
VTAATLTLTEFLLARLDEDEEIARECVRLGVDVGDLSGWVEISGKGTDATEALFSRFSPARVLADCEAKRRIVERATAAEEALRQPGLDDSAYFIRLSCRDSWRLAVADLALSYADHPDYRQEWRP